MNFFSSKKVELPKHNPVLAYALQIPALQKLVGKRVILASNSPRRREILQTFGLAPEVVPSNFEETLPFGGFQDPHEYPVATASHKAVEVYERLVTEDPDDAPDLVIAADTVVLTHPMPGLSSIPRFADEAPFPQDILEKPIDKDDNMRMLLDFNGGVCEVVTGVSIVFPVLEAPGYKIKSIEERTLVYFAENDRRLLEAYVSSGEGADRAGGFAIQGLGGMLISKIEGDYNNVVGFPAASFFKFLDLLVEEEVDFLSD
ncbi:N-acetylserotonin O-methyltransferase-like protein [Trametes pubescens]|uniref:N-acetylserotonin O-methyltransferase-like protein n=1 Tax=Trametes pubescens TaxID=154538 RepID=A0A1M2W5J5_TRAPU|nr:N-acetylserotonin O-methyltransferase-like protein [Trametes pubescens]